LSGPDIENPKTFMIVEMCQLALQATRIYVKEL
jgi:hypothetical protein